MNINNPIQMAHMIAQCGNPQELVINLLESRAQGNPFMQNLLSLAKEGKSTDIEQIAKNMLKEQGFDYDKEFSNFKRNLGL